PAPTRRARTTAGTGTRGTLRCRASYGRASEARPRPPSPAPHADSVPRASSIRRPLDLLVGGDVPAHLRLGAGPTLVGLGSIVDLHLCEIQTHVLGQTIFAARSARRDRADEDVFHRDDQVLERVLARLAHDQLGLLQMLAVAARQIEVRRGH